MKKIKDVEIKQSFKKLKILGDLKLRNLQNKYIKKIIIKFIFANYGYGKIENFYKFNKINSFKDLKNFI